jgi:cation transport regulator ChaC
MTEEWIDPTEFSPRARNLLYQREINSIEKLASKSESQVRKWRNCGKKTIAEFRAALAKRGLSFEQYASAPSEKLRRKAEALEVALAQKEERIKELETKLAQLPIQDHVVERLEVQVERFAQLMSKLFRKERRQALAEELEKLNNGELL